MDKDKRCTVGEVLEGELFEGELMDTSKTYTVSEVANLFDRSGAAVRHWISKGWLAAENAGKNRYAITHDALVKFAIKSPKNATDRVLKLLGFSISEIYGMKAAQFLEVEYVPGETTTEELIGMLADRLTDNTEQIQDISAEIHNLENKRWNIQMDYHKTEGIYKDMVKLAAEEDEF